MKKPLALRQPLRVAAKEEPSKPKHLATAVVPPAIQHGTKAASRSPEPEDMEVVLRHDVNDIDILDKENPQLCAEYVKEIYQYMLELEVCWHREGSWTSHALSVQVYVCWNTITAMRHLG